jgi:hypothetical protein
MNEKQMKNIISMCRYDSHQEMLAKFRQLEQQRPDIVQVGRLNSS